MNFNIVFSTIVKPAAGKYSGWDSRVNELGWESTVQAHNLLSETLGTRHVSEIGIFRISEW
jgi:hypothetical protein